jgi:hypothetical protein
MSSLNSLTLLEISTAMKRTSLSKSFRTFGLMAMLSVLVATTLQQPVQAQKSTQLKAPASCNLKLKDGFFVEFQGIKFTPKQEAAYKRISAKIGKEAEAQMKNVGTEPNPDAPIRVITNEGIGDKKYREILDAVETLMRAKVSTKEQIRLMTEQYGQYATFSQQSRLRFTPEQIAAKEKMNRDFEAQMMSIFTPQQQKVYRANLVIKRQIEACDTNKTDG